MRIESIKRASTNGLDWSNEDVGILKGLWEESGKTATDIASEMNRTRCSILSAVRRFRLARRNNHTESMHIVRNAVVTRAVRESQAVVRHAKVKIEKYPRLSLYPEWQEFLR